MKENKKIIAINCNMSAGGGIVMMGIAETARKCSMDYYTFSPEVKELAPKNHFYITSRYEKYVNKRISQITGYDNATIKFGTRSFIRIIDSLKPDLIHIHGLHGWYVDYHILFEYIKKNNIPVVWTQHDCWAFTGKCTHFSVANCYKWKRYCYNCPQLEKYPESKLIDNSKRMFFFKKNIFTGMRNITIVSVSKWMENILGDSYFKEYPIITIENGIDTNIFKYSVSELKKKEVLIKDF